MPTPNNSTPPPSPPPPNNPANPLLVALSGPTSSGKTTLATALRRILPPPHTLTLIHADDFYKPDSRIPLTRDGVQDWDCAGSLDLEALEGALRGVKEEEGDPLAGLTRQGNFENDGVHSVQGGISTEVIERMRNEVRESWLAGPAGSREGRKIVFVDGFLLFGKSVPAPLRDLFDVKILLRARYEDAKRRREGRSGYVTLEGFWRDPEGYFDGVVWPNFVGEHEGLVEVGEGEGRFGEEVWCSDERWGLERCLEWVVGVLGREVRGGEKGVDG